MLAAIFAILVAGWNLIGGIQEPTPQAFYDSHPTCPYIYGWDGEHQHFHWWFAGVPDFVMGGGRGLTALSPYYGYWVYCNGVANG